MRERGDCLCLHETFMYYYYIHLAKRELPHFDAEQNRPSSFKDIISMFRQQAIQQTVFAKEMGYYVFPEILRHPEIARDFVHIFLVRDLRKSLISYFKLDPDIACEEVGLESQWKLYQWITELSGKAPRIVEAENIQRDPKLIIGNLWQQIGLSFKPDAFNWDQSSNPAEWKQVDQWHQKTLSKNSIQADGPNELELQREFSLQAENHPKMSQYLEHHWPFYQKLIGIARDQSG